MASGGSVAYWWAADLDAAVHKALSLGGRLYRGPIDTPGDRRICQVIDPFGNVFGLEGPRRETAADSSS